MKVKSKYAQPLPDRLEEVARKIYSTHQRGGKNRGDQLDEIIAKARLKPQERDMVFLRAQRLQLDGLPPAPASRSDADEGEAARRTALKRVSKPAPSGEKGKPVKTTPTQSSARQSGGKNHTKPAPAKKSPEKREKLPF